MKIKMIATDLDETLLHTDKSLSAYTIDILRRCSNKGIKLVAATARGNSVKKLLPNDLFDARILTNGAKAFAGDVIVYDSTMPVDVFKPLLKQLTAHGINAAAKIGGIHHANFDVRTRWSYIDYFLLSDLENFPGGADKLYAVIETPAQRETVLGIVPEQLHMHISKDNLAMLMHAGATKQNAIAAVAKHFGIAMQEIVAFGDDTNDIGMLKAVGTGVAMANALDSVKQVADEICLTNDEEGVAKWLCQHLL